MFASESLSLFRILSPSFIFTWPAVSNNAFEICRKFAIVVHENMKLMETIPLNNEKVSHKVSVRKLPNCWPYYTALQYVSNLETQRSLKPKNHWDPKNLGGQQLPKISSANQTACWHLLQLWKSLGQKHTEISFRSQNTTKLLKYLILLDKKTSFFRKCLKKGDREVDPLIQATFPNKRASRVV